MSLSSLRAEDAEWGHLFQGGVTTFPVVPRLLCCPGEITGSSLPRCHACPARGNKLYVTPCEGQVTAVPSSPIQEGGSPEPNEPALGGRRPRDHCQLHRSGAGGRWASLGSGGAPGIPVQDTMRVWGSRDTALSKYDVRPLWCSDLLAYPAARLLLPPAGTAFGRARGITIAQSCTRGTVTFEEVTHPARHHTAPQCPDCHHSDLFLVDTKRRNRPVSTPGNTREGAACRCGSHFLSRKQTEVRW